MIFEEIIDNQYKIISHDKVLDKLDRKNIFIFLENKKKLEIEKNICACINTSKLDEIDIKISIINDNIKKIKEKYSNIFIEEI